jgi:3',5'-cyclic AMP phosphodiesterase CpdA
VVVVAVGDISCEPDHPRFHDAQGPTEQCRMRPVAQLAAAQSPAAVLLLGDIQYPAGALEAFRSAFDPIWGSLKARMRPVPGNHEYLTPGAAGYFAYFGAAAGDPQNGYYSFELGSWHLVALNSNCREVGGCGEGSPQLRWLQRDLKASKAVCTLAYWHHPRFSSSVHGDDVSVAPLFAALQRAGAELVLSGHDHTYERFAPQREPGVRDEPRGLRQLVVGTGGRSLYAFRGIRPNSEARFNQGYGVLRLSLRATGYDWEFLPVEGVSFSERGSAECH